MKRRLVALAAVAALAVVSTSFAGFRMSTLRKVDRLKEQQRRVGVGAMALFVDDCGGIRPELGVDAPNRLSTPIAYVERADMQDPFGKPGERLLFVPGRYYSNSTAFAVISRGPDGDLDSRRLPRLRKHRAELHLPGGTVYTTARTTVTLPAWPSPELRQVDAVSYVAPDGKTVENPLVPMLLLPDVSRVGSPAEESPRYTRWFVENGVAAYDPTNGVWSDGDCLAFY